MEQKVRERFEQSTAAVRLAGEKLAKKVAQAAQLIVQAYGAGKSVLLFGNGGSAADAQHIAAELVGRFLKERPGFKAEALTTDGAVLTSLCNDYGYDKVFAHQIQAKGVEGDVAVALSTSGNSPNVVEALAEARRGGMKTIVLSGAGGGKCAELADVLLDVPSDQTPRIQEAHVVIYHIICELVEEALSENV